VALESHLGWTSVRINRSIT